MEKFTLLILFGISVFPLIFEVSEILCHVS